MDIFLTTHKPLTKERKYFEKLTWYSLVYNGFKPVRIQKPMLERYWEAERLATTDIYIVCDNDIILERPDTLLKLEETMRKHPDFAIMGLGWRKDMKAERGSAWKLGEMDDVWEFYSAGGCLAIRKGILKDLGYKMEFENYGDDRVLGQTVRALNYKVGVAHKLLMIHLGNGNEYTTFRQEDSFEDN